MHEQNNYTQLVVFTDGGSRGNPGPAGIGIVVAESENYVEPIVAQGEYLGPVYTNNEAEYMALIRALEVIKRYSPQKVTCYLDSELVVKQITGLYKIKKPHLQAFCKQIQTLSKDIPMLEFKHIPRENNAHADSLVNEALDAELKNKGG